MDEQKILKLYIHDGYTLRHIAEAMGTNHHMVRRILVRNGVEITQQGRKRRPFSEEHRRRIGQSRIGISSWSKGKKLSESFRRANMKAKLHTHIDLEQYADYERLLFLTKFLSKRKGYIGYDDSSREAFLNKFYFDPQFNTIYEKWIMMGKNKWYRPTLDHKLSQSNGGGWGLDNLQFLTWFENRAKAEMNKDEWLTFCSLTCTTSDLFIRI